MSDQRSTRSLTDRALDVLVFAPAGLALTALNELRRTPELVAKGRERFGAQITNAKVIGQFAVAIGRHSLDARVANLARMRTTERGPREDDVNGSAGDREESAGETPRAGARARARPLGADEVLAPGEAAASGTPDEVDDAIPGYAALSASQVVPRLDSLGPPELESVYRHEATTRRRRTILHRAQQLLGLEHPPGPAD